MAPGPHRATLDPAFRVAIGEVFDRAEAGRGVLSIVARRPPLGGGLTSVLETHDPRFVSSISDAIRRITEDQWWQHFGGPGRHTPAYANKVAGTVLAVGDDAAFPLMTDRSGYVREAAVEAVRSIPGPFCLALLIYRLNDWVPQVRRAAERKLAALIGQLDVKVLLGCVELLWEFERFHRADSSGREFVLGLLHSAALRQALRDEITGQQSDRAFRLLRFQLRTSALDDALEGIATTHKHANVRAAAMRTLIQKAYRWSADETTHQRSLTVAVDQESLARRALRDRAPKVQLVGVEYVANHGTGWADSEDILLSLLGSPSRPVAEMAQWGLKTRGVDWVRELRRRLFNAPKPLPRIACALGDCGDETDGEAILKIAADYKDADALPFLAAAAKLKSMDASDRLNSIATGAADLVLARRASRALRAADVLPDMAALHQIADRGDEFFNRGLGAHLGRLSALVQLKILCRLEQSRAQFDPDPRFGIIRRKVNRGAFAPTADDLRELRVLFAKCPRVRELAKQHLALVP